MMIGNPQKRQLKKMLDSYSDAELMLISELCMTILSERSDDDVLVMDCDLSIRAINATRKIEREECVELKTLRQLSRYGKDQLLHCKQVGEKTIQELEDVMNANGFHFSILKTIPNHCHA